MSLIVHTQEEADAEPRQLRLKGRHVPAVAAAERERSNWLAGPCYGRGRRAIAFDRLHPVASVSTSNYNTCIKFKLYVGY